MRLTLHSQDIGVCTLGKISLDGEFFAYVLENPWLDNKRMVSCIPAGYYRLEPHVSPKYGNCYALFGKNVGIDDEERTHILIHSGNIEKHTHGCLLLGSSVGCLDGQVAVLNSRNTVKRLMKVLDGYSHDLRIYR
jgi:hypothetical protein